ncbi:MAG: hypothetical protein ABRQ37_19705 [Candidatus Eremiobacterota bacterium]
MKINGNTLVATGFKTNTLPEEKTKTIKDQFTPCEKQDNLHTMPKPWAVRDPSLEKLHDKAVKSYFDYRNSPVGETIAGVSMLALSGMGGRLLGTIIGGTTGGVIGTAAAMAAAGTLACLPFLSDNKTEQVKNFFTGAAPAALGAYMGFSHPIATGAIIVGGSIANNFIKYNRYMNLDEEYNRLCDEKLLQQQAGKDSI